MNKKLIIIGGGVAGLSAGIYSKANGFDTEIIEMHTVPGGQCTAWERKGYRFDYCLHWLVGTANGPFNQIWKETNVINESVKVINHDVHSKIIDDKDNEFIIYSNIDRWEKYLLEIAPEDSVSIKKMCSDMKKLRKLNPFTDAPGLRNPLLYILSLFKMGTAIQIMTKYGKTSCKEYFQKLKFTNPRILLIFNSIYADRDFSALAFLMMLVWFDQKNAGYLMGGSLPMANRMKEKFLSLGGKLTLGRKVEQIIVESDTAKGVLLADGTQILADYVISAADGYTTLFKMLEGKYLTDQIKKAYNTWPLFTPIVQVSFGLEKIIMTEIPSISYLSKNTKIGSTRLASGYSFMNYSFDPTMAPEGKSVIVLRYESPWEIWKDLDADEYDAEKKQIETDSKALLEKHYPGIKENIKVMDVATPITDVRYTGVWQGSYEGFLPTSKNITETIKMTIPDLKNFYMCGQWLFPGGGLPPAAQSGKWAAQLICRKENKKFSCKVL